MLALRPVRVEPVSLAALAGVAGAPIHRADGAAADAPVTGITHDSRAVQPGDLYAALPGAHVHGADYATEAVDRGAVAVLSDRPVGGVPTIVTADPRAVLGSVSAAVYGEPSRRLALYGVTGTNGKTTTAYLLEAGLRAAGRTTGLIGTIESHIAGEVVPSVRTTPEATELQALLAVMVERGVQACAMEVSSHALALGRVTGTRFVAALFTNLSQDHLDFHRDMDEYFAAKATLFTEAFTDLAVIDVTDPWGAKLADQIGADVEVVRVGADATAQTRLLGDFNARNAVLAVAALTATGIDDRVARDGVAALTGVPGRLERVDAGQDFLAVVDYAHTPEAVARLLAALRPLTRGRLVVVLGCGGDRDAGKRPLMGAAAAVAADVAIFTDDNPRSEPSGEILAAMLAGVPVDVRDRVVVEPDRAVAIARATVGLGAGDTVVVAGKGHEKGQDAGGVVTPFDDRDVLRHSILAAQAAP